MPLFSIALRWESAALYLVSAEKYAGLIWHSAVSKYRLLRLGPPLMSWRSSGANKTHCTCPINSLILRIGTPDTEIRLWRLASLRVAAPKYRKAGFQGKGKPGIVSKIL